MDTFFLPPSCSQPKPLCPLTNNTHESALLAAEPPNWATASNGAHQHSKLTIVNPPKSTAFPVAAVGTELLDDTNRSIGQTYCFETAGDGPYVAAGIVACNRIVVANTLCT